MKKNKLMRELQKLADARGLSLEFVRHGNRHDIYRLGNVQFPVGRHADIPERTAQAIIKEAGNQ
ncbi:MULTISPECIES: hypothetical protein [Nocardia]|uniref:Type II toxin-antitoxin system HicA family toxin n=1 Tax=Nocardia nova TaxID=37330 RepID=A0A2T2Z892_9NOCA|nr:MULTISPECIES: hypothetical protein [Nocardia]PSR63983.1 hypothetical protein C8259_09025 [Nocardia nova]